MPYRYIKKFFIFFALLFFVGSGCGFFGTKSKVANEINVDELLAEYEYGGVPEGLAAQHRIELLSVKQVSGVARKPVVDHYAQSAVNAFREGKMFQWHEGITDDDKRIVAYAQKNDAGECLGFRAYYSLLPTGGIKDNRITKIETSNRCELQDAKEQDAHIKEEQTRAQELMKGL